MFGPVAPADRDAITGEGERMLAFAAPDAGALDVRFAPVT
jgi:hypothetical protein